VVVDESTWAIEQADTLVVTLQKEEDQEWKELVKGETRVAKKLVDQAMLTRVLDEIWRHAALYQVEVGTGKRAVWCMCSLFLQSSVCFIPSFFCQMSWMRLDLLCGTLTPQT